MGAAAAVALAGGVGSEFPNLQATHPSCRQSPSFVSDTALDMVCNLGSVGLLTFLGKLHSLVASDV